MSEEVSTSTHVVACTDRHVKRLEHYVVSGIDKWRLLIRYISRTNTERPDIAVVVNRYVMPEVIIGKEYRFTVRTARIRSDAGEAASGNVVFIGILLHEVGISFHTTDIARRPGETPFGDVCS